MPEKVTQAIKRDHRGRFMKGGAVANPGGRPRHRGLSARIRDITKDGKSITDFLMSVLDGTHEDMPAKKSERMELRWRAAQELSNRGWGLPTETLQVEGGEVGGLAIHRFEERLVTPDRLREVSQTLLEILPVAPAADESSALVEAEWVLEPPEGDE